ncbi:hypothetical protein Hanom_Chr04g00297381 [Helianthus anomalus]
MPFGLSRLQFSSCRRQSCNRRCFQARRWPSSVLLSFGLFGKRHRLLSLSRGAATTFFLSLSC